MIELKQYTPELHDAWNAFVAKSKNATFLHNREYMDYHSDRFEDCSLVALSKGNIIALLPANRVGSTLYSHQGLTYGGWLMPVKHFTIIDMLEIFDEMKSFLPSIGINELIYKAVPHIYHTYPAEEDLYAIFRHNGTLIETNVSSTITLENPVKFSYNYSREVRLAEQKNIVVKETEDLEPFWNALSSLLGTKYDTVPVHSLNEISLLKERFPKNIRLFEAVCEDRLLGGALIYDCAGVAHVQYIATTQEGRDNYVLPYLFDHLINETFKDRKYFDFGISNEDHGRYLNEGLAKQKCYMGGRAIVYNTYKIVF